MFAKNVIKKRVMAKVNEKIDEGQREYEEGLSEIAGNLSDDLRYAHERFNDSKEGLIDAIVNKIFS